MPHITHLHPLTHSKQNSSTDMIFYSLTRLPISSRDSHHRRRPSLQVKNIYTDSYLWLHCTPLLNLNCYCHCIHCSDIVRPFCNSSVVITYHWEKEEIKRLHVRDLANGLPGSSVNKLCVCLVTHSSFSISKNGLCVQSWRVLTTGVPSWWKRTHGAPWKHPRDPFGNRCRRGAPF